MQEIAKLQISVLVDRGYKKIMTNVVRGDRVFGFIKPSL
jgi:hypothetical protein